MGLVLLVPNAAACLGASLAVVGVLFQVRIVEESYLSHIHSTAYRDHAARVGRFLPGVGRIETSNSRAQAVQDG
jgi:protein-S-isoprenylcysteine O-methyltransferase Ste14